MNEAPGYLARPMRSLTIFSIGFLWLIVCVEARRIKSDTLFEVLYVVWTLNVVVIPLIFALAGIISFPDRHLDAPAKRSRTWIAVSLGILAALVSYAACASIITKVSEIWWSAVKTGAAEVSFGISAINVFLFLLLLIAVLNTAAYVLHANGRAIRNLVGGSIGMALSACALYLLLGLSTYAVWRP